MPVVAVYAAARGLGLVVVAVVALVGSHGIASLLGKWDSYWYLQVVRHGYPSVLPRRNGAVAGNDTAFFPLVPLVIRLVGAATPLSDLWAGVVTSLVSGLTATLAVRALAREIWGSVAGDGAALAFAVFPGAFVFDMVYAEGTMITFAALCLLALVRKRWLGAALLGALASASHSTAVVLAASAAYAACAALRADGVLRWRERRLALRSWRPLLAPALAPAGFVGFQAYLWAHTGQPLAWFETERGGWHSGLSLGAPLRAASRALEDPRRLGDVVVTVLLVLCVVAAAWLWRARTPAPVVIYALGSLALAVFSSGLGARPRFVLDAFPLVAVVGARFHGAALRRVLYASTLALGALTALTVTTRLLVP